MQHRNFIQCDEGINKVYKSDIDMAYKPDIDINQCYEYQFNDPFNLNVYPPSYNFIYKYDVIPRNVPKYRKVSQSGVISCKEGNVPEASNLTSLQRE